MQKNNQSQIFPLVATALLVTISVLLSKLAIFIPLFGYPSVRFSFTGIPIFIAGALFGGVYGAAAGFITDMIGFMLAGSANGPYHPGFTINMMLLGLIPGVIFHYVRKKEIKHSFVLVNSIVSAVALVGVMIYINFTGIKQLEVIGTVFGIPTNIVLSVLMVVILIALHIIFKVIQNRFQDSDGIYNIHLITFIMIISYIVVQLVCTPIWLHQLYGIPVVASITVRVFKSLIDVPLQVMFVYIILKSIPVQIKGKCAV